MAFKKETKKKKSSVSNGEGAVHIKVSANNTLVSLTDSFGNTLAQSSAGKLGYRGAKKSTPYVAQQVVEDVLKNAAGFGIKKIAIYIKGAGAGGGREAAVRAATTYDGIGVTMFKDVSPIPHNGCRPPKARRL